MKISVVIPCYNVEKYVSRCIESVLKQNISKQDFEILAINDGSTDKTLQILRGYEEKYSHIRVINQMNKGLGETRNNGIENVESDYIAFLDSDDWIDQDYLKVLYSLAEEYSLDIVNSGFRRPKPNGEILFQSNLLDQESSFFTNGTAWGKLYRTQFLKEKQIRNRISAFGEDIIFNLDCFEAGAKFKTTEYIGYNWFINDESLTRSSRDEEKIVETCKIFYKALCETSAKINSYYIILYASATLFLQI
ncbi:glycosyltransferase family 2 protein [Lactococcus cremoris]|uniref:glycosyltransferase family 2 protein n=1 Tax=Lactococcus lactis subsp. cremoris TaxID=1359 RepID=UPI0037BEB3A4